MPPPMTTTSAMNDATGVRDVLLELLHQVGRRGELDVRVQPAHEAELEPPLVQVSFEVEQERLDFELRPAEGRPVADGECGDEITLGGVDAACVRAQRRDELVRLRADVRRGKPE